MRFLSNLPAPGAPPERLKYNRPSASPPDAWASEICTVQREAEHFAVVAIPIAKESSQSQTTSQQQTRYQSTTRASKLFSIYPF